MKVATYSFVVSSLCVKVATYSFVLSNVCVKVATNCKIKLALRRKVKFNWNSFEVIVWREKLREYWREQHRRSVYLEL